MPELRTIDTLYYCNHDSILSNLHPCKLVHEGERFNSVEQAYQYSKAKHAVDFIAAEEILLCNDSYELVRLGKRIFLEDASGWDDLRLDVMWKLLNGKFKQNPILASYLMSTSNRRLVEATNNSFWGAGAKIHEVLKVKWTGENHAGSMLMQIRTELNLLQYRNMSNLTKGRR